MAATMTASELADHVTRNWHVLTGRPYREMHQEGEFPEAVLALVEAHGVDYQEFVDAWTVHHG